MLTGRVYIGFSNTYYACRFCAATRDLYYVYRERIRDKHLHSIHYLYKFRFITET